MASTGGYTSGAFAAAIMAIRLWVYLRRPRADNPEDDPITLDLKPARLPPSPMTTPRLFGPEQYPELAPQLLAALWYMRSIRPGELPLIAAALLDRGLDTPHLRQLAGDPGQTYRDLDELAAKTLSELGVAAPFSPQASLLCILQAVAQRVTSGDLPPQQAVDFIVVMNDWELTHDLPGRFVRLAFDYDMLLAHNPVANTSAIDDAVRALCNEVAATVPQTTQPGSEPG